MIDAKVTVAQLLEEHPDLLLVLEESHPHFRHLRNRVLRKLMAPRVTVARAARIAGIEPDDLLAKLRAAAGEVTEAERSGAPEPRVAPSVPPPTDVRPPASLRRVDVDVRADIAGGVEPFARIMAAVKALGPDEAIVLRVPFEPVPLYDVLGKRGFSHWTEPERPGDWSVWFFRAAPSSPPKPVTPTATPSPGASAPLDVRGLEPPMPLVVVLERLDALGPDDELVVVHDRRPLFLYPQLEDRGFVHRTEEAEPGVVRILIRRRHESAR
jgi:uncharacterized protein (DUF2249 family)